MADGLPRSLGLDPNAFRDDELAVHTSIDGSRLAAVRLEGHAAVAIRVERTEQTFRAWRQVSVPHRGELMRLSGEELRRHEAELGELMSWETGKIIREGLGEVQKMIDICDLAMGLSRQLYGLITASERPGHHMRETWHPLGVVDVISAFSFPVAA